MVVAPMLLSLTANTPTHHASSWSQHTTLQSVRAPNKVNAFARQGGILKAAFFGDGLRVGHGKGQGDVHAVAKQR